MAVLATDDFDRADSATLGANWSLRRGNDWTIATNKAVFTTATPDSAMWYSSLSFPNDQYSQVVLAGLTGTGADTGLGVCVRCDTGSLGCGAPCANFYGVVVTAAGSNNVSLQKYTANAWSVINQRTQAFSDGDTLRLEVQGTTLRIYRNGVQVGTSTTDTSFSVGSPGLYHAASFSGGTIDDWEGGDLTTGATVAWLTA